MAGPCIHGYAPGACLICQTLDRPQVKEASTTVARRPAGDSPPAMRGRPGVESRSGPRVVPKEPPRTGSPGVVKLVALAVAVVVVIVVAWTVLHLVFAVLHILELIGVAIFAGYLGYLAGMHRARHVKGHS